MKPITHVFPVVFLALLFSLGLAVGAENGKDLTMVPCFDVNNLDVDWRGSSFGLFPSLSERAKKCLEMLRTAEADGSLISRRERLKTLLRDRERFVVAHVLLTLTGATQFPVTSTEWNHLRVELGTESATVEEGQREEILAMWDREEPPGVKPRG